MIDVTRGAHPSPDLSIAGEPQAWAAVLYGKAPLDLIQWSGDAKLLERVIDLYHLPQKAPLPGH
jgi:hypothetical protein